MSKNLSSCLAILSLREVPSSSANNCPGISMAAAHRGPWASFQVHVGHLPVFAEKATQVFRRLFIFLLNCKSYLYVLDKSPLLQMCGLQIFSTFRGLSFHCLLTVSFQHRSLNFDVVQCFYFCFVTCSFGVFFKESAFGFIHPFYSFLFPKFIFSSFIISIFFRFNIFCLALWTHNFLTL